MTPEVFQQIASGVQSIAVALAMVVGGTWGVYEFRVRRADRKADKKAEIESRRAKVDGELELSVQPGFESGTWLIGVRHTFANCGNRGMKIQWGTAPLRVALVKPAKLSDGGLTWQPEGDFEAHSFAAFDTDSSMAVNPRKLYLGPGESWVSQTLVPVERDGVYHLVFEYEQLGKEAEEAKRELGGDSGRPVKSWDHGLVIVRPPSDPTN